MAIEYGLDLGGRLSADDVADVFAQIVAAAELSGAAVDAPGLLGEGARLASGVLVVIRPAAPLPFPDPVQERFGIIPTADVLFRLDSFQDTQHQQRDVVRLTSGLLSRTGCDAVLTFAGELVDLLHKDGRLVISRRDFWTSDLLDLLPWPYERTSLPVL